MKVRAAVLREMGKSRPYAESKPVVIETIELAPPGAGEMLVKILAAGICHSDLSVVDGSRPRVMPMVLGHEACGEVVECGRDVNDFHGHRVANQEMARFNPTAIGSILRSVRDVAVGQQHGRVVTGRTRQDRDLKRFGPFGAHHGDNFAIKSNSQAKHRLSLQCNLTIALSGQARRRFRPGERAIHCEHGAATMGHGPTPIIC